MTKRNGTIWLAVAVITTFLAVGIPYWMIPYAKLNLPNGLMHLTLGVATLAALLLCTYRMASTWRAVWFVTAAVVAVVFVRIVVEGVMDPTSHNLWPFEIGIALFVGLVATAPGAIVGTLVRPLLHPPADGGH